MNTCAPLYDRTPATLAIASSDCVGEGPVWDHAKQRLLWIDYLAGTIHEARVNAAGAWRETGRWELRRHIAAVIPRASGGLVIAAGTEVLLLNDAGKLTPFVFLDVDPKLIRMNDAKCDSQGRLWVTTLSTRFRPEATLYRVDPDGTLTATLDGLALANGLDWSIDGSRFYLVDTLNAAVDLFDFDACAGTIRERRTFLRLEHGAGGGNGLTVDRDDCLWVALTGGGEIRRYSPSGSLLQSVEISVPGATSCAFGGPQYQDLFITSRSGRMPEVALTLGISSDKMESIGCEAGALFVCRPGPRGKPVHFFAG